MFHTDGVPPSDGNSIFATIGWTRNSSDEPRNDVTTNSATAARAPVGAGQMPPVPVPGSDGSVVASAVGAPVTVMIDSS